MLYLPVPNTTLTRPLHPLLLSTPQNKCHTCQRPANVLSGRSAMPINALCPECYKTDATKHPEDLKRCTMCTEVKKCPAGKKICNQCSSYYFVSLKKRHDKATGDNCECPECHLTKPLSLFKTLVTSEPSTVCQDCTIWNNRYYKPQGHCQCVLCGDVKPWTGDNFRIDKGKVGESCLDCREGSKSKARQEKYVALDNGQGPSQKLCKACNVTKPRDAFVKHGLTADGLDNRCKECCNAMERINEARKPKREAVVATIDPVATQECQECHETKATTEFQFRRGKFTRYCTVCIGKRGYTARYRLRQRLEDLEGFRRKMRERSAAYRRNNPEYMKAFNAWYKQTPQYRLTAIKCTAKERGIQFNLTDEQALELMNENKHCYYCNSKASNNMGFDRLNSSLPYDHGNIVTCCRNCNIFKSTLDVVSFCQLCLLVMPNGEDIDPDLFDARPWNVNGNCSLCTGGNDTSGNFCCNRCLWMFQISAKRSTLEDLQFIVEHCTNVVETMAGKWRNFLVDEATPFPGIKWTTKVTYKALKQQRQ